MIGSTFYVKDRFFYLLLCFKILCDAPPSNGWKFQPSHILPSSESSRLFCCIAELAVGEKRIGLHVEVESGREIEERRGEERRGAPERTNERKRRLQSCFPIKVQRARRRIERDRGRLRPSAKKTQRECEARAESYARCLLNIPPILIYSM